MVDTQKAHEGKLLLRMENVCTVFSSEYGKLRAVDDLSLYVNSGETLGIVGESGSGKTMTAMSIMNMIENPGKIESGRIVFEGNDLLQKTEEEMIKLRGGDIAMVFQDSLSSLNPTMTVGDQIARVIRYHGCRDNSQIKGKVIELLAKVGIPEPERRYKNYPHEFSGGMRQRALIAMAISSDPKLLILDEPTTALDVTIEAQIFELIDTLKDQIDMGIILITHDLSVVANTCDRVLVMYAGKPVEEGSVKDVFDRPRHPYTHGLMLSIPRVERMREKRLYSVPGEVPDLIDMPVGCSFAPRCNHKRSKCMQDTPVLVDYGSQHRSACFYSEEFIHET